MYVLHQPSAFSCESDPLWDTLRWSGGIFEIKINRENEFIKFILNGIKFQGLNRKASLSGLM